MSTADQATPRQLAPEELAGVIKLLREVRQWSQEQLATISGLSTRTIQRAENGKPSDRDTRRALARAFDLEDIDAFNKPYSIPTPEEAEAAREKFEREHITLDCHPLTTGRQLADLAQTHSLDLSTPGFEMPRAAEEQFAQMTDYMREFRDCADLYSEMDKIEIYDELQNHIDALEAIDVSLRYAVRKVQLTTKSNPDAVPWQTTALYVVTFPKGQEPTKFATLRKMGIG